MEVLQAWRTMVAVMILVGCGRTRMSGMAPTTTGPQRPASEVRSGTWAARLDTRASANDSGDAGSAGQCGSQITFQIAAAPADSFCAYNCDSLSTMPSLLGPRNSWPTISRIPFCAAICDSVRCSPCVPLSRHQAVPRRRLQLSLGWELLPQRWHLRRAALPGTSALRAVRDTTPGRSARCEALSRVTTAPRCNSCKIWPAAPRV